MAPELRLVLLPFIPGTQGPRPVDALKDIMLVDSLDDSMLIRPGDKEVTRILNLLSKHMSQGVVELRGHLSRMPSINQIV